MRWLNKLAQCLFEWLSKLGFRNLIIKTFVFDPPKISYTVRQINRPFNNQEIHQYKSDFSSINNDSQDKKNECISFSTHGFSTIIINEHNTYDHRPNSFDKHLPNQPKFFSERVNKTLILNKSKNNDFILKSPQKKRKNSRAAENTAFILNEKLKNKNQQDIKQVNKSSFEKYFKPKNLERYPPYQFMFINNIQQIQILEEEENLNIISYLLHSSQNSQIATLFLEIQDVKIKQVLLYSHGNSSDLGYMIDTYIDLALNLNINILAYDYQGYGQSSGQCSDINAIDDIQTAYEFLVNELEFLPSNIFLYGYSLGSGPTISLASSSYNEIGGLIIHSGIASGIRVYDSQIQKTCYYDVFPNIDLIKYVGCPIMIIHGLIDNEVSFKNGELLAENCKRLYEFWLVQNGNHGNIDEDQESRNTFFQKLRGFLCDIQNNDKQDSINQKQMKNVIVNQPFDHLYSQIFNWIGQYDSANINYFESEINSENPINSISMNKLIRNSFETQNHHPFSSNENSIQYQSLK